MFILVPVLSTMTSKSDSYSNNFELTFRTNKRSNMLRLTMTEFFFQPGLKDLVRDLELNKEETKLLLHYYNLSPDDRILDQMSENEIGLSKKEI